MSPRANGERAPLPPTAIVRSNGDSGFSMAGRVAGAGALLAVLVLIALVVLGNQGGYTVKAVFENASGLVTGNSVLIGPAQVGTVDSIGLTRDGAAEVTMSLNGDVAP